MPAPIEAKYGFGVYGTDLYGPLTLPGSSGGGVRVTNTSGTIGVVRQQPGSVGQVRQLPSATEGVRQIPQEG